MGGSTPYSGTTLPAELGVAATFNFSSDGMYWQNAVTKHSAINKTMDNVVASPSTYAGGRLSAVNEFRSGSLIVGTGTVLAVTAEGVLTGLASAFLTELFEGSVVTFADNGTPAAYQSVTVVKVWNDTSAMCVNPKGAAIVASGGAGGAPYTVLTDPQMDLPLLNNPKVYMTTADYSGNIHLAAMASIGAIAASVDAGMMQVWNPDGTFTETMNEVQFGLGTYATVGAAASDLQQSIAAAKQAISSAETFLSQVSTLNAGTTLGTYVQPQVDMLTAERDRDISTIQRGFTVANGFFNTNINDRVVEIQNKYALQIKALIAEESIKLSEMAVRCIDALLSFQNGPLRDKIMVQELRLKAMQVGMQVYLSGEQALQQRWSALYGVANDAIKRDFANDAALWGSKEDNMRFCAELQQAYMGALNAGVGKGTDAMGVAKQVLGMAVTAAGAVAAFVPGGQLAAGGVASAGKALMSGGGSGGVA